MADLADGHPRRLRARAGRGDRAAQPERLLDGLRRARVRTTRSILLDALDRRRRARPRGARREPRRARTRRRRRRGPTRACRRRSRGSSALLEGSEVEARALQDPLSFRTLAQLNGAARDAFGFVAVPARDRAQRRAVEPARRSSTRTGSISVGNFEIQPLATALDLARLALAPVISSAAERAVKLLQAPLTGLPRGARRPAGARRERAQRVRHRGAGVRGRGTAARPTRLASSSSRRPRPRESRTG